MPITPFRQRQITELRIKQHQMPIFTGIRSILGLSCAEFGWFIGLQGSKATVSRDIRRWEAAEAAGNPEAIHPVVRRMLQLILAQPHLVDWLEHFDRRTGE